MITTEQLRELLPRLLSEQITNGQIGMILDDCCVCIWAVNGCTLTDMRRAIPELFNLGIIAIPGTQGGPDNLVSVTFLKK